MLCIILVFIAAASTLLNYKTHAQAPGTNLIHVLKHPSEKVNKEKADSLVEPFDFIFHNEGHKLPNYIVLGGDTISFGEREHAGPLTEEDYREVANRLKVDVASIKAVVEIEAGRQHKGFWAENKPLINFDLAMFRNFAARNKINLKPYVKSHSVVFSRPNIAAYGSQQAAQQARLDAAMKINPLTAIQGTFWGMFQIGGFNWKRTGVSSPQEFVMLMSRSERDQLDMFAEFIVSTGLDKHLRNKDWRSFARGYNGPSYAAKGYHTKLANAYKKHSANSKA